MFCTIINIFWFFLCSAQVAVDVSQQWTQPNGESLLPSRWNDLELAKNKGLDNDDSNGRCLGWQCLRVVGQCRASRRYHDLRRPRPRPRHAATVTVTAGHWHGLSRSLTLRSTCRESSFSRRVGIIPQRHWGEKNLNLPKLKATLTVPAGDRRRSPGRTVQRRPGGPGRPSGKTWSFMFKGQQPEITGCKQWQPWLGQHSGLPSLWPVGAVRAGKNWPAGLHLSKFE